MRRVLDSGTGSTCGQIGGDVIATKRGIEHFGALHRHTKDNMCFRGSVTKPQLLAGRTGKWPGGGGGGEETVMEDEEEQREQMRKEITVTRKRSEGATDKQGAAAKLW